MPDRRELELRLAHALDIATDRPDDDVVALSVVNALAGRFEPGEDARDAMLERHRGDLGLDAPLADGATEGRNLGPSMGAEGLRPGGITRFSPDYRTVLLDSVGAVALKLSPTGELAVYLELGGRVNKRQERDEGAYLMPPAMGAELVAEVIVAANAAGTDVADELMAHLDRKRAERGIA